MVTSYFGRISDLERIGHANFVSVCRRVPPFYSAMCARDGRFRMMPRLAPSEELLSMRRGGLLSDAEFSERYLSFLAGLSPSEVASELGGDAVLLCYEASGSFCHRRILAGWLESGCGTGVPEETFGNSFLF